MSMNANEIKSTARAATAALLSNVFENYVAVQFADASWAILQEIDGQEVWTEVTIKSKAYKPTKVSPAFDPYEVAEAWQADKASSLHRQILPRWDLGAQSVPVL